MNKTYTIILSVVLIACLSILCLDLCSASEEEYATCWVLCKKGSQVNVRRYPRKSEKVGFLEIGDSFLTDGTTENGYIKCYRIGEYGYGWIYSGYVATEEPQAVFQNYICSAKKQVACRRWIGGPQIKNHPWLKNGCSVSVFYIADGWAVTNYGYIQAEWLDPNP